MIIKLEIIELNHQCQNLFAHNSGIFPDQHTVNGHSLSLFSIQCVTEKKKPKFPQPYLVQYYSPPPPQKKNNNNTFPYASNEKYAEQEGE